MEFEFLIEGKAYKVSLEKKGGVFVFSDGKGTFEADINFITNNVISILIAGRSHKVYFAKDKNKRYFYVGGNQFIVEESRKIDSNFQQVDKKAAQDNLMIKAPMPGKVIKINVSEKEQVRKNQTLAIVEAMKMENEIKSSLEGYVKKIFVSAGDLVDSKKPLIELGINE